MSTSAHFSVTTAGAIVLGGIAAIVLATVIALRGSERQGGATAPVNSSQAAPSRSATPGPAASIDGAPLETEIEYLPDTNN